VREHGGEESPPYGRSPRGRRRNGRAGAGAVALRRAPTQRGQRRAVRRGGGCPTPGAGVKVRARTCRCRPTPGAGVKAPWLPRPLGERLGEARVVRASAELGARKEIAKERDVGRAGRDRGPREGARELVDRRVARLAPGGHL